jgi:two-component system chemotaxis sensor kinase CheA
MKPLEGALTNLRASWGFALLASGEVAMVLDCERLVVGEGK